MQGYFSSNSKVLIFELLDVLSKRVSDMPRPPRLLFPKTVALLTSRVQQGLPFVNTPLIEAILWSALAVAQNKHPVQILSFVIIRNHVHILALVEDPSDVESFMERFKRKLLEREPR